jgi:uncharacterized Zn-finger protein
MNVFLKKLMTLATELNDAEGFNALVVVNEMELLYDKHVTELKNLHIACVMPQSEQLCDHVYFDNTQNPNICIYCSHKREPK